MDEHMEERKIGQVLQNNNSAPSKGNLVLVRDVFHCRTLGSCAGIWWVEARHAAKHPTMPWTAFHHQESSRPSVSNTPYAAKP